MTDIARLKTALDGPEDRGQPGDREAEEPRLLLVFAGAEARSSTMSPPTSSSRRRTRPRSSACSKACYELGVPVTPRGSGTGNYGQAMPLSGGVVLNLADMNAREVGRARPRRSPRPARSSPRSTSETRPVGQEIRLHPSTYNTASDRRLHRRRLGRRRLDQLGRPARTSATCSASASSPWRRARASSISRAAT